jgi:hypothetical protein
MVTPDCELTFDTDCGLKPDTDEADVLDEQAV